MEYTIEDLKKAFEAGYNSASLYWDGPDSCIIESDYTFEDWILHVYSPVIEPRPHT